MLYRLRKLTLCDASTIENIDNICQYYGINRILGIIIELISLGGCYK